MWLQRYADLLMAIDSCAIHNFNYSKIFDIYLDVKYYGFYMRFFCFGNIFLLNCKEIISVLCKYKFIFLLQ